MSMNGMSRYSWILEILHSIILNLNPSALLPLCIHFFSLREIRGIIKNDKLHVHSHANLNHHRKIGTTLNISYNVSDRPVLAVHQRSNVRLLLSAHSSVRDT